MAIVFVLVALLVLAVLVTGNWYLWRRLFRDTTRAPGAVRRVGAVVIAGGWAVTFAAFFATRSGAPFWLKQVLAWPGYLWLALCLYLLLAVLVGEAARPVLRRVPERRARRTATTTPDQEPTPIPAGATAAAVSPFATATATAAPGTSQPADADAPRRPVARPPRPPPTPPTSPPPRRPPPAPPGGCSSPGWSPGPPPRRPSERSGTERTAWCADRR